MEPRSHVLPDLRGCVSGSLFMALNGKQLDTSVEIVTPENIAFRYRVAGPFRRLPAYLVDLAIRIGISIAVLIVAGLVQVLISESLGKILAEIALVLVFLLEWFWGGLWETFWNGQTPGKRLLGIRVVSIDGQPITGWQAVLRNVLRIVDMQPLLLYQVGLWSASLTERFQRLGDLACGTMVIIEERTGLQGVLPSGEPGAARLAEAIPANFVVSRSLGLALAAYVQRRRMFSWGRRIEISHQLGETFCRRFNLPPNTDLDLLLCALYERTFLADDERQRRNAPGTSPFAQPAQPQDPLAWLDRISTVSAAGGRP